MGILSNIFRRKVIHQEHTPSETKRFDQVLQMDWLYLLPGRLDLAYPYNDDCISSRVPEASLDIIKVSAERADHTWSLKIEITGNMCLQSGEEARFGGGTLLSRDILLYQQAFSSLGFKVADDGFTSFLVRSYWLEREGLPTAEMFKLFGAVDEVMKKTLRGIDAIPHVVEPDRGLRFRDGWRLYEIHVQEAELNWSMLHDLH